MPRAPRISRRPATSVTGGSEDCPGGLGSVRVRDAVSSDLPLIHEYICALAEYEQLPHEVTVTPELLAHAFFGEKPRVFALILEVDEGRAAGMATWFYTFSTFAGLPGIWIEDVYVEPKHRNKGLGQAVFKHLARRAVAEGCARLEWAVLAWNEPAMAFYRVMGASVMDAWRLQRLTGDALIRVAQ